MRKTLAKVAMQQREPGLLDVDFAIYRRRMYRRATRRAVLSLDCDSRSAGRQSVRLQALMCLRGGARGCCMLENLPTQDRGGEGV